MRTEPVDKDEPFVIFGCTITSLPSDTIDPSRNGHVNHLDKVMMGEILAFGMPGAFCSYSINIYHQSSIIHFFPGPLKPLPLSTGGKGRADGHETKLVGGCICR
jgi:hypothetical protein